MKTFLALTYLAAASLISDAASWPQFRGPNCSGIAEDGAPPNHFGPESNLIWKISIPHGLSSPVIVGDRLFITAFDAGKLITIAFDRTRGKELWRKEAAAEREPEVHKISSPAVATPATDGRQLYAFFPSFGLLAYSMDGEEKWKCPLPVEFVINGSGTSPIVAGDSIVVNCDQDNGRSFIVALDARTGKQRWQTARSDFPGSYSTPIFWKHAGTEEIIVPGSLRVVGYDLGTGAERWTARVLTSASVTPTPVIGDGQLFVMSRGVPANAMGTFADFASKNDKNGDNKISRDESPRGFLDGGVFRGIDRDKDGFITDKDWSEMTATFSRGESGLFALREPGVGDITATHVSWKQTKGIAGISSPLFYRERVYVVQDGGRLSCWEAKTGRPVYEQERLQSEGEYYASPIAVNGHIFLMSARGTVTVVKAGDRFEIVSRNAIRESAMATPASADSKVYIRGSKHLWAFGK